MSNNPASNNPASNNVMSNNLAPKSTANTEAKNYISYPVVRSLINFLELNAIDHKALCNDLGFSINPDEESDELLDAKVYWKLLEAAINKTGNQSLGLEFGISAEPDRWGVVGYIMSCCHTLADAIECQLRYQDLIGSIGSVSRTQENNDILMTWNTQDAPYPPIAEEAMAGWVKFARWITATEHSPSTVYFRHSEPKDLTPYTDFFQCRLVFGSPFIGLAFPASLLMATLKQPNDNMKKWLLLHADEKLTTLKGDQKISYTLRQYIEHTLPKQIPTLNDAAEALSLTKRTLQRRLAEEGTNFSGFLEQTRHNFAKRYLTSSDRSLVEIAFLLGFSEQSAFTRAFKKNENQTPSEYRREIIKK